MPYLTYLLVQHAVICVHASVSQQAGAGIESKHGRKLQQVRHFGFKVFALSDCLFHNQSEISETDLTDLFHMLQPFSLRSCIQIPGRASNRLATA